MPRSGSRSPSSRRRSKSPRRRSGSPRRRSGSPRRRSDSPRRSSSPRRRSPSRQAFETIRLTDADAAFILGKAGRTKEKIARVSGANVELPPRSLTLEISGSATEVRKAKKYVECVMAQRSGDVTIDERDEDFKEDCTLVDVPTECVGFVTGTNGNFLRTLEAENGTIMFFVLLRGDGGRKPRGLERLAIFGDERGRRQCELKVFAAIEQKIEGHLTRDLHEHISEKEGFSTDLLRLKTDEMSWALGRKGATRKKLARASGAIVEYIGNWVHVSGTKAERHRAREYLKCVMEQMDNRHSQIITEGRDDVTVMNIPQDCVGYVMGNKRATLTRIEEESGAFMLFLDRKGETGRDAYVKLGIFGIKRNRRAAELKVMSSVEGKAPGYFTRDMREGHDDSKDWGTDIFRFRGEEFSYALGKDGSTRKKLMRASHCLMEYVGEYAVMSGTRAERERAWRYLKWLLDQKTGAVTIEGLGIDGTQEDVKLMDIPSAAISFVMGSKGSELRKIEEETNTFLFVARDRNHDEVLVICGADKMDRKHAEYELHQAVNDYEAGRGRGRSPSPGYDNPSKYPRIGDGGRRRSPSYDRYDRRRSPSYDRRRSPSYDRRRRTPSRDRRDDRRSDRRSRERSRDRYDDRDRRDRSPARIADKRRDDSRDRRREDSRDRRRDDSRRREDSRDRRRGDSREKRREDSRDRRRERDDSRDRSRR